MKISNRYLAIGFSLLIIAGAFYYFSDIVAYILIAWVLSMIGQPLMYSFKKYLKLGKVGSAGLTLISFIVIFGGLIWIFVPPIVQQARNLGGIDYASLVGALEEPINSVNNLLVEKGLMEGEIIETTKDSLLQDSVAISEQEIITIDSQNINLNAATPKTNSVTTTSVAIDSILLANGDTVTKTNITLSINIENQPPLPDHSHSVDTSAIVKVSDTPIEKLQKRIFSTFNPARIPDLFSTVVGFMGNLVIAIMSILFITFFFLKEQGLFVNILEAVVPAGYEKQVIHAVEDASMLLRRYFVGVTIQVISITIFMTILLSIIGIKNALLIAFFAALINVIPYIGPIIGATFGIFITISSNLDLPFYSEMLPLLLMVFGAFALMQMLDNFILQPYIFSNSVLAHPLEIFIVILVGAKLSGIVGMVLAIPVYTVVRVIARAFLSEFKIVQKLTGSLKEQ